MTELNDSILDCAGLSKHFGGVYAIQNIDLSVKRGDIHLIIGPNGAGKTTLFNVLTGVYAADGGQISFNGTTMERISPERAAAVGMTRTFQNLQLFHELTVLENVMVGLHLHSKSGMLAGALGFRQGAAERRLRNRGLELLEQFELGDRADDMPGDLSFGGQRQLELARAVAMEPAMLLLDEPAAGLSQIERTRLAEFLRSLRGSMTVLLIEHDMRFALQIADQVTVLDAGAKIAEGPPDTVRSDEAVIAAYLGTG